MSGYRTPSYASPPRAAYSTPSFSPARTMNSSLRLHELNDEESLAMLKSQISQVRSMKIDIERKDLLISEQQRQLSDLTHYKDEYYKTKAQLQIVEDRARSSEQDFLGKSNALLEKIRDLEASEQTLRKQVVQLERDRLDEAREAKSKINDLESEVGGLRNEFARAENKARTLSFELEASTKQAQSSAQHAKEREIQLETTLRQLQQEVATLNLEKRDALAANAQLAAEVENRRSDNEVRLREIAMLEKGSQDQQRVIAEQRRDLAVLEDRLRVASAEAARVPGLRSELQETADQLQRERQNRRMLDEVKKRVEELNTELEEYQSPTRTSPMRRGF
eukprot:TRINITY_DN12951_c0_g1_i1.p1 TRINITY_DN12951_c0_g1~~TRINITY_DN12951_c0_g1_i1.p1  ORF type:complete len:353 (+),score=107.21 TRINITY_DN12951_c0_g1_i1:52-1059(+)